MKKPVVDGNQTYGIVFFGDDSEAHDVYRWTLDINPELGDRETRYRLLIEGRDEKGRPVALVSAILKKLDRPEDDRP